MAEQLFVGSGEPIGEYIVQGMIGSGGTGAVYRVFNADDEDVRIAVKVCKLDVRDLPADERVKHMRRLQREFNILQANPHPYIVPVYSFGYDRVIGQFYIAMEWVQGISLHRMLTEDSQPLRHLVEIFGRVVEAVAHLHRKGVIHRDLKPDNILVRSTREPVLIDFGISRAPWLESVTQTGELCGTWDYTSPECRTWEHAEPYAPKPADDVFALGVILYQLLTGALPFKRGGAIQAPPVHPSDRAPSAPRALGELALRMLELDPTKRLQDGQAVRDALLVAKEEAAPFLFAPAPEPVTEELSLPGAPLPSEPARPKTLPPPSAAPTPVSGRPGRRWQHPRDLFIQLRAWLSHTARSAAQQAPRTALASWHAHPRLSAGFVTGALIALIMLGVMIRPWLAPLWRSTWVAVVCTVATGNLSCASVPVRSDEEFMAECPPGAQKTTADLGLATTKYYTAQLEDWVGEGRRRETPLFISSGPVVAVVDARGSRYERERPTLNGARLIGQARLLSDRVSIQYTKLELTDGRSYPLCAVAFTHDAPEFGPGIQEWPDPGQVQPFPEELEALKELQQGKELPIGYRRHFFQVR